MMGNSFVAAALAPTAGAVGYILSPLAGLGFNQAGRGDGRWRRFPTADAVGYFLSPLRGW